MIYTIEEQAKIGERIAEIFLLKEDYQQKTYQTSWGAKTAVGLYNTILSIAEKISNGEDI